MCEPYAWKFSLRESKSKAGVPANSVTMLIDLVTEILRVPSNTWNMYMP